MLIFCAVCSHAMLYAAFRRRVARLLEVERLRTRIATDLQRRDVRQVRSPRSLSSARSRAGSAPATAAMALYPTSPTSRASWSIR